VFGYDKYYMNTKVLTAILLIGIATAIIAPPNLPDALGANSDASSAAVGVNGIANSLANAAAAALGGGIATTNTNSVSNVVNGLSTTLGNAGSASLSPFGSAAANGNVAAAALGGLATGNTASNTFSGPGLSTAINTGNSAAWGFNPLSTSASNTATALNGLGLAAGGANAGAAVSGSGVTGTTTNSASGNVGGNSFSSSSSSSVAQSLPIGSLAGQYEFGWDPIPVIVNYDYFIFRGCTDYKIPITRRGRNIEFGATIFTEPSCGYDPAFYLSQRFYQVARYFRNTDGFAGFVNDEELFTIRYKAGVKSGRQVYDNYYEGEYEGLHPRYNIQIDNNRLWFQGYQNLPLEFDYSDGGNISFERYVRGRRNLGFYNRDSSLYDLFSSCSRVNARGQNNGYSFVDKKGRSLAYFFSRKW
jgi:hypothetical protein